MAPGNTLENITEVNRETQEQVPTVLVTGASGWLASEAIVALLAKDYRVIALSRQVRPVRMSCRPKLCWIRTTEDLTNSLSEIRGALGQSTVSCVIHCAGLAHAHGLVGPMAENKYYQANVGYTEQVLGLMDALNCSSLVYLSSVKVLGEITSATGLPESTTPKPTSLYGRTKRQAEDIIAGWAALKSHRNAVILRLGMVYGEGQTGPNPASNLARMEKLVRKGVFPPLPVVNAPRAVVHVEDATQAIVLAVKFTMHAVLTSSVEKMVICQAKTTATDLYEMVLAGLGLPKPKWRVPIWTLWLVASVGSLFSKILALIGLSAVAVRVPFTLSEAEKLLKPQWYIADKAKNLLGWQAEQRGAKSRT